ncbi:MAG: hypothetical protein PHS56_10220 [Eubacteriales bacterium]|nr:hypothetical protein [Eubacteriales bacterium]
MSKQGVTVDIADYINSDFYRGAGTGLLAAGFVGYHSPDPGTVPLAALIVGGVLYCIGLLSQNKERRKPIEA